MRKNNQSGFIKLIVIILVIIVVLSLLRVDLRGFTTGSPSVALKSNFTLIRDYVVIGWNYAVKAVLWVWNGVTEFARGQNFERLRQEVEEKRALESAQ